MGIRAGTWAATMAAVLVASVVIASAAAQGPAAVRKQAEASLLVTGTIDLRADGSVERLTSGTDAEARLISA